MNKVDALLIGCGVVLVLVCPAACSISALYIGVGALGDP